MVSRVATVREPVLVMSNEFGCHAIPMCNLHMEAGEITVWYPTRVLIYTFEFLNFYDAKCVKYMYVLHLAGILM